jgi:hypothetical protein
MSSYRGWVLGASVLVLATLGVSCEDRQPKGLVVSPNESNKERLISKDGIGAGDSVGINSNWGGMENRGPGSTMPIGNGIGGMGSTGFDPSMDPTYSRPPSGSGFTQQPIDPMIGQPFPGTMAGMWDGLSDRPSSQWTISDGTP